MPTNEPADLKHHHLTREDLRIILENTDTVEERKPLFHALALCPVCEQNLEPLLDVWLKGAILTHTSAGEVEAEIEEHRAPERWRRIEEELGLVEGVLPPMDRLEKTTRWPTWGLAAWHAWQSLEAARRDPRLALYWAELATSGAMRLQPGDSVPPEAWLAELRAFAHAARGNAHRVAGQLEPAEAAFAQARTFLHVRHGEGDTACYLPYRPWVYQAESSLFRDQRLYPKALQRLDEAYEAWARVERARPEDRARVLLQKAKIFDELHLVEAASEMHEQAAGMLGPRADDGFRLTVLNNWLFYLARLGRAEEAAEHLAELKDLAAAVGNDLDSLRVTWVEAYVSEAEGDPDRAETLYRRVLDGFCEREIGYDAALAAMDLTRVLLSQGAVGEAKEMALAVKPIFEALGVGPEVRRAVRAYLAAQRQEGEAIRTVGLLAQVWWEAGPLSVS